MANKNIPLKDKELVKQRLAQGASTREAIKGTSISSPNTAHRILKQEKDEIGRIKEDYLLLIEQFGAGKIDRAKLWAEMTQATKVISARVIIKKGSATNITQEGGLPDADSKTDDFIEVPDWQNREKALRYIDTLAGITQEENKRLVNILNVVKVDQDKYGF